MTLTELQTEIEKSIKLHGDCMVLHHIAKAIKSTGAINGKCINERQIYYADYFRLEANLLLTEPKINTISSEKEEILKHRINCIKASHRQPL